MGEKPVPVPGQRGGILIRCVRGRKPQLRVTVAGIEHRCAHCRSHETVEVSWDVLEHYRAQVSKGVVRHDTL